MSNPTIEDIHADFSFCAPTLESIGPIEGDYRTLIFVDEYDRRIKTLVHKARFSARRLERFKGAKLYTVKGKMIATDEGEVILFVRYLFTRRARTLDQYWIQGTINDVVESDTYNYATVQPDGFDRVVPIDTNKPRVVGQHVRITGPLLFPGGVPQLLDVTYIDM